MYLTLNDLKRIEEWLYSRTVKDTDFSDADPLYGN